MDITPETPDQTEARLRRVLAAAHMQVEDEPYVFAQTPVADFPAHWLPHAKAFVRDHEVWSALIPARIAPEQSGSLELFRVLSFHFDASIPNSGFVGWLATSLKRALGTGVFVVCGDNPRAGGIFDYWGVPWVLGDQAIAKLHELKGQR
jgi:hypothetical protein